MSTLINKNPERRVQYKIEANKTEIMFPNLECLSAALLRDLLPSGSSPAGDSAYITDASDLVPVESLKVNIQPVQTGTGDPSPENVREITGWDSVKVTRAGKNLVNFINSRMSNGVTFSYDAETGGVSVSGTATSNAYSDDTMSESIVKKYIRLKAGTYTQSITTDTPGTDARLYVQALYDDGTAMSAVTTEPGVTKSFTLTADAWIYPRIQVLSGTTVNGKVFPMIEAGTTATEFEPPMIADYTVPLDKTVYGGTLDVTTGELVVDRIEKIFDGTSAFWELQSINSYGIANFQLYGGLPGGVIGEANAFISNRFAPQASLIVNTKDEGIYVNNRNIMFVRINSDRANTVEAFDAWLANNPVQMVYELNTPITYTLTPQEITLLLGDNTVFADAGPIEVTYGADIQRYIDKKIAETQALILEN